MRRSRSPALQTGTPGEVAAGCWWQCAGCSWLRVATGYRQLQRGQRSWRGEVVGAASGASPFPLLCSTPRRDPFVFIKVTPGVRRSPWRRGTCWCGGTVQIRSLCAPLGPHMMGWELAYPDLNSQLPCGMRNFGKIE